MKHSPKNEFLKKRGIFICFAGIDGSGKTTLSNLVVTLLEERGIKSSYVYNRYLPLILKPFMIIGEKVFLHKNDFFGDYNDYSETKKAKTKRYPFLANIYQTILIIDYSFQILFKIKIPMLLGKNIICDRYIYDTIVTDLSVDFNYSEEKIERISRHVGKLFPKPDIVFFVDVPEEVAFSRKDDVPSIQYLRDRRHIFAKVASIFNMKKLDGTKKIEELLIDIRNEIGV